MTISAKSAKVTAEILVRRRDVLDARIAEYHAATKAERENPQSIKCAQEWVIQRDLIADMLAALHGSPGSLNIF